MEMSKKVNIGKRVKGEELLETLIEAAEEVGLGAKPVDRHELEYELGSVREEQVYRGTELRLSGKILPKFKVAGIRKEGAQDWFYIGRGPYGLGSKKLIREYLQAVSNRI